ncbi:MAG: HNH endonuclease [Edafosvirus sp.]|uniref:HNH endonuclease n=1 Tax=Edafosvirus sp. TaxID=2487765 RepID=A0A3G4ZWN5_9VIRU|nr:MAG: HNH endonuclease [Edafosvirus sp.]
MVVWKKAKGYSKYEMSDEGETRSDKTKNILVKNIEGGYYKVTLTDDNGKRCPRLVYRLIALAHIPNTDETKKTVDHINANKLDDSVKNLRWVIKSVNNRNPNNHKKERNDKIIQKDQFGKKVKTWKNMKEIEDSKEFTYDGVRRCCNKILETYKKYVWEWDDPSRHIVKEEIDIDDDEYMEIKNVRDCEFPNYKMSKDAKYVVNVISKKAVRKFVDDVGYYACEIYDSKHEKHKLLWHRLYYCLVNDVPYTDKLVVNHIDKNRLNDHIDNLELITQKENTQKAVGKKVNQIDMKTKKIIKSFNSLGDASRAVNKNGTSCISKVCNGKQKYAYGYKWTWNTD